MSNTPSDDVLFELIKEHFGLDKRPFDTVIDRKTGMFHDAARYRDFAAAVLAKWGTPQPVVREPLTPIRQAAFDIYVLPFRQEYGYIRDANNQMVADDAGSEGAGTIAARIRGWGRIQYMDKPELRAEALQDEVGNIVVEALNAYWAAHGITQKGGSNAE